MSEGQSFFQKYEDEIACFGLGYGYGIINCTVAVFFGKGVSEKDWLLMALAVLSMPLVGICYRAMKRYVELLGKEDGARAARREGLFRRAHMLGFLLFLVLFRLFIFG